MPDDYTLFYLHVNKQAVIFVIANLWRYASIVTFCVVRAMERMEARIVEREDMQLRDDSDAREALVTRLYERYAPALFAHLRRRTLTREDAEDVLAQVFVAVIEDRKIGCLDEDEQVAWLWQVARNKAVDTYRRTKLRQGLDLELFTDVIYEEDEHTPEEISLRHEEYAQLHAYLEHLSPVQREAMRLRFARGLHCAEIGAVLGKGEGAVRVMLSRALNLLRTIYAKDQGRIGL
jgi:RNA polymerase sigma-70 factor (ECF subfamily)